jgi:hypothetical protein
LQDVAPPGGEIREDNKESKRLFSNPSGIVNLAIIDELIIINSGQKWGVSPN